MRHHAFAAAVGLCDRCHPCSLQSVPGGRARSYRLLVQAGCRARIEDPGLQMRLRANPQLCAKIAWLKDPNDSKGQPLHDIRNEDSLDARPAHRWPLDFRRDRAERAGNLDRQDLQSRGRPYLRATLTMISRTEIKLRGCKAWLLCGEKQWLRTSAPPPDASACDSDRRHAADRGFGSRRLTSLPPVATGRRLLAAKPPATPDAQPKVEAVAARTRRRRGRAAARRPSERRGSITAEKLPSMPAPQAPVEQSSDRPAEPEADAGQHLLSPTPAQAGYRRCGTAMASSMSPPPRRHRRGNIRREPDEHVQA